MPATVVLVAIASAPAVFAQKELPRGHIGGGIAGATTDEAERMRLASEARPWIWSGELSVRVAPRVSIGAEVIDLGTAIGATSGRSFRSTGEQRERAVVGLARVRTGATERAAVDLVGGGGLLLQRHVVEEEACFVQCTPAVSDELTHRAPAFVAGVDVPVRIGRNFSIAATGRYYFLRRGDNTSSAPAGPVRWQFEYRSSGRIAVGAAARVTW